MEKENGNVGGKKISDLDDRSIEKNSVWRRPRKMGGKIRAAGICGTYQKYKV